MNKDRFDYAIKDHQYVHIDIFKPGVGADCGCFCPVCGDPVKSNIRRSKKSEFTNRFSHSSTCDGGHGETELHKVAKTILEQNKSLNIFPIADFKSTLTYDRVTLEPSIKSTSFKQFRPDLILHTNDARQIAVEIFVTHRVSEDKAELFKNEKLPCLEIDLSKYHNEILKDYHDEIEDAILKDLDSKKWIWPVKVEIEIKPNPKEEKQNEFSWQDAFMAAVGGWLFYKAGKWMLSKLNIRPLNTINKKNIKRRTRYNK